MIDLTLFNYDADQLPDADAFGILLGLRDFLASAGISPDRIQITSGNHQFPTTAKLIKDVIDYWYAATRCPEARFQNIHSSFFLLDRYLRGEDWEDARLGLHWEFFSQGAVDLSLRCQIIGLAEQDTPPVFFHTVIITGPDYPLVNPNGDAFRSKYGWPGFCMNRTLSKNSIWHETAHVLGADDCYDPETKKPLRGCTSHDFCIMQYNSRLGNRFCRRSLQEIRSYVENF